jgi:uncharacterized repeat protein (TIGR02543 family)
MQKHLLSLLLKTRVLNRVRIIFIGFICALNLSLDAQTTRYVGSYAEFVSAISNSSTSVTDIIEIQNDIVVSGFTPGAGNNYSAVSISKSITINGNGNTFTVSVTGVTDGGKNNTGSNGTSTASGFRLFYITGSSKTITINDLVIKGGNIGSNGSGGAIYNAADKLVLNNVTISNSRSSVGTNQLGNGGGGISNQSTGKIYLNNCMITRNSAGYGGGFLNNGGVMFIEKTTITENRSEFSAGGGGGCENKGGGYLYFNNCTFSNNKSTELGGGINNYMSYLYVANSTFTGNVAYGNYPAGAISNRNVEYIVNCIFAYNYYRSSGSTTSPSAFTLDDFAYSSGSSVNGYYNIHHSSSNKFNTSTSTGNILYTGKADGSDNTIFAGGVYTKITDGDGNEIGTGLVYQPLLVSNTANKTATLKLGSFPNNTGNKGVVTGYTNGNGTASLGYKNPSTGSWANITGSSASSNTVTSDQLGTTRSTTAPIRGSVETEISPVYMLKVRSTTNGTTSGASIYGDVYSSGTQVTVTAAANTGYQFSYWRDVDQNSTLSTNNPYTLTISGNLTIEPVFVASSTYTVTYLGNNNTSGAAPSSQSFTSGNSVVLAGSGTLERDEYYFAGWNTQPSGGGTNYTAGSTYNTGANLTLYAKWVPYVKYYIKTGSTSALTSTSNWTGYPDGTGGNPTNFGSDKIFILDNTAGSTTFSLTNNWTVSGALQIPVGKTLNIANNITLELLGDVLNSGTIVASGSSSQLLLNGSVHQSLGGTNQLAKLGIENSEGATLKGPTSISNSLTLTSGTLITDGYLTFKSTASSTGVLNEVPASGASISGLVNVERYVPARRAFRFVSSSVNSTSTIYANWQENGSNAAGLGTHITGSNKSLGFDSTLTGNPSMFTFNNSNQTWAAINNTNNTNLVAGTPYRLMVRGDRTVSLATNTPTPTNTTLRATGNLVLGTVNVTNLNSTTDGYSLVGNPYQSSVDMQTVLNGSTNLNKSFYYIWDPTISTRGGYVTVDVVNNTATSNSSASRLLQPGQAMFVKTSSNSSASLSFTESSKGNGLTSVWRTQPAMSTLKLQLWQSDSLKSINAKPLDGLFIHFDSTYKNEYDERDALKPTNLDENFAVLSNGKLLSVESRKVPNIWDSIQFNFTQIRDSKYTIKFDLSAEIDRDVYVLDRYLNTEERLNHVGESEYSFTVSAEPASRMSNRFLLVFKENTQTSAVSIILKPAVQIYPNPSIGNEITIELPYPTLSLVHIRMFNSVGQEIMTKSIQHPSKNIKMELPDNISKGNYLFEVSCGGRQHTINWIKN